MSATDTEALVVPDTLPPEAGLPIAHWRCWLCMSDEGPAICGHPGPRRRPFDPAVGVKCGRCLKLVPEHDCASW